MAVATGGVEGYGAHDRIADNVGDLCLLARFPLLTLMLHMLGRDIAVQIRAAVLRGKT